MIHSMTAFARREYQDESGSFIIELRSVNHRYLEQSLRLPEELRQLEPRIREQIQQCLGRGKIDCNIRYQPPEQFSSLKVDRDLVQHLARLLGEVDGLLERPAAISSLDVLQWPGVMQLPVADPARLQARAMDLLDESLQELLATRQREGEKLKSFILDRCVTMEQRVDGLRAHVPQVMQQWRERLLVRLAELQEAPEPARLEQEMLILAQRLDVTEELDRLTAHLEEIHRVLEQQEPVGRRLDFLMQELNREANTLSSKSQDGQTTREAVELKVLIEQMREQVQNIQ